MGVPLIIIHFERWDFWHKSSSYWSTPMTMATSMSAHTPYSLVLFKQLVTCFASRSRCCWSGEDSRSSWPSEVASLRARSQPFQRMLVVSACCMHPTCLSLPFSLTIPIDFDGFLYQPASGQGLSIWCPRSLMDSIIVQSWHWLQSPKKSSGWWFGTFYIFPYIWNNHPNWLIFFRGVQTTNQQFFGGHLIIRLYPSISS